MADEDDARLRALVEEFGLDDEVVQSVKVAVGNDARRAFEVLCEMVVPQHERDAATMQSGLRAAPRAVDSLEREEDAALHIREERPESGDAMRSAKDTRVSGTMDVHSKIDQLIAEFKLDHEMVRFVLEALENDEEQAFELLCEMVGNFDFPLCPENPSSEASQHGPTVDACPASASQSGNQPDISATHVKYRRKQPKDSQGQSPAGSENHRQPRQRPRASSKTSLKLSYQEFHKAIDDDAFANVWTNQYHGGGRRLAAKERAPELCLKYPWAERRVVEHLFEQLDGDGAKVEETLRLMLPQVEDAPDFVLPVREVGNDSERASEQYVPSARSGGAVSAMETTSAGTEGGAFESGGSQAFDKLNISVKELEQDMLELARSVTCKMQLSGREEGELLVPFARLLALGTQRDSCLRLAASSRNYNFVNQANALERQRAPLEHQIMQLVTAPGHSFALVDTLDLHGLLVKDALFLTRAKLAACRQARLDGCVDAKLSRQLQLITGRGNRSGSKGAAIRPALEAFLTDRRLKYTLDPHGGILRVRV
ncbi:hypothetical protein FVE85_9474 [Porphyridium purpureum]|uniref:Smr domain-containing protein n=1 Tax=Porphyridium purpureum TaxID=35688 RepID=A0A5J4YIG5_PORPP|nr:hypothetical protein FVE85_9474 [Porphyridium purpureum]|eukprot:POR5368..scf261_15